MEKTCPLKMLKASAGCMGSITCDRENCTWWRKESGSCAVKGLPNMFQSQSIAACAREMNEAITRLEKVSGMDIETITQCFLKGYTLRK